MKPRTGTLLGPVVVVTHYLEERQLAFKELPYDVYSIKLATGLVKKHAALVVSEEARTISHTC